MFSHIQHFNARVFFYLSGDCHDTVGRKDRCVTGAIYNYTEQLLLGVHDLNSEINSKPHLLIRLVTNALKYIEYISG